MSKWNYVFGAVTIGLIVGGTIYAIKKAKDAEKAEEEAINLDEAREIVAREREANKEKRTRPTEEAVHEVVNGEEEVKFQAPIEPKLAPMNKKYELDEEEDIELDEGIEELEDDPLRDDYPVTPGGIVVTPVEPLKDFMYQEPGIDPKEDKELRYPPNSVEAKHQFIRMELADWDHEGDTYQIMLQLFEFPFIPTNVGDELLYTQLIEYRAEFFGITSKWTKEVSFADVIFHYARSATFNVGEFFPYWVEYFLQFNDFTWDSTSRQFETLLLRLCSHTYFNEERQTFGLFGLTRESMDQAIRIASGNPDRSVSFEIEFQEFLKSHL